MTAIQYIFYLAIIFISNIAAYSLGRSNKSLEQKNKKLRRFKCINSWLNDYSSLRTCNMREHGCISQLCREHCKLLDCNCGVYNTLPINELKQISQEEQEILEEIRKV